MTKTLIGLLFCTMSAFACNPTSGWIAFTPRITGLNNVTISDAAYAVDSDCTASVRLSFSGIAPGNSYATFTLPVPFPLGMTLAAAIDANGHPNSAAVFAWTDGIHLNVNPYDGRIPSSGETDGYLISGSFQTP